LVSKISSTALSASIQTLILFTPLSLVGTIGTSKDRESIYRIPGIVSLLITCVVKSGKVLFISITIALLIAFPIFIIFKSTWKLVSATEIKLGVTFIN